MMGYLHKTTGTMEMETVDGTGCDSPPKGPTAEESADVARLWELEQSYITTLAGSEWRPVWTLDPGQKQPVPIRQ